MDLNGSVTISAPRSAVWAALNDPDVLARCIEGVESLTRTGSGADERFEGRMAAKVGPVRATFAGTVRLEDIVPGASYRLVGEGKGGVAGFAKGSADVALSDADGGATRLDYQVKAQVGGKLAQLGARLIEGTAKQYATSFFANLQAELEAPPAAAAEPASPPAAPPELAPAGGLSPLLWGGGLIALVFAFLAWQWL
jgi:hypothetical protein